MTVEVATCQLPNGWTVHCVDEAQTATLYREIFVNRCWLDRGLRLAPGDIVFDVGANIGLSTLFFHVNCPGLRVFCFEPSPVPFRALVANVETHGIDATCRQVALGTTPGHTSLTYYPQLTAMSGLHADPVADSAVTRTYLRNCGFTDEDTWVLVPEPHASVTLPCEVTRLSDEVRMAGVPRIDLLKIDVEKSELEVLDGIDEQTWPTIRQIAIEVHDEHGALATIVDRLRGNGFTTQVRQDRLLAGTTIHDVAGIRTAS
jgi:31-O-methyltransferase